MKLLVIGGSYFLGRVFVMQTAKEHDITLVNRGTLSMESFGVQQIKGDRRDAAVWQGIKEDFDVVIDFCAYEKGDISTVLRHIRGKVKQYIFISTLDVYRRGQKIVKTEEAPFEDRVFPGEAGAYIAGKVALERELREECLSAGVDYTVLRPAFIYGAFNYAPRESAYIQLMVQNRILPRIVDAAGRFQFVYVKDAAEAAVKCLLNPAAYGQSYNLCQDETVTYEAFYQSLKMAAEADGETVEETGGEPGAAAGRCTESGAGIGACAEPDADARGCAEPDADARGCTEPDADARGCVEPDADARGCVESDADARGCTETDAAAHTDTGSRIQELPLTAAEAQRMGIPLPFPVTEEESELSSNEKSRTELGVCYSSLREGMERTYRAFKGVYS